MPIIYDAPGAYAPPTFGDLVDEVISILQGYTLTPDMVTYLTDSLDATATSVKIEMPEGGCGVGVFEIGDELVFVHRVDDQAGTLTLLPQGRGWRGTVAEPHAAGDTVVVSPLVPRHRVKRAINDAVAALWPSVFAVETVEVDWVPGPTFAYPLPAEAEQVLDVRYKDQYGNWVKIRRYEAVRSLDAAQLPSGVGVRIGENPPFATKVQVVYGRRVTPFDAETVDPVSDAGLSPSAKDVLIYGALVRLVPALDVGRLSVQYVPADELDQPRQLGSAMALAREFKKDYELAILREQQALQNLYPARMHFVSAR